MLNLATTAIATTRHASGERVRVLETAARSFARFSFERFSRSGPVQHFYS